MDESVFDCNLPDLKFKEAFHMQFYDERVGPIDFFFCQCNDDQNAISDMFLIHEKNLFKLDNKVLFDVFRETIISFLANEHNLDKDFFKIVEYERHRTKVSAKVIFNEEGVVIAKIRGILK